MAYNRARSGSPGGKEDNTMKRAFSLVGVAALLAASISIAPGPARAQQQDAPLTKGGVKAGAARAAQTAAQKWNSLTPAQQQQIMQKAQLTAQAAQQKWDSMTPQQQQQAIQMAKGAAGKFLKWWQSIPDK